MLTIAVDDTHNVSAPLEVPERASACRGLAHGAGAEALAAILDIFAAWVKRVVAAG